MEQNKEFTICPHRVNVGSIFIALAKSITQPLSCIILIPLTLLIPSLAGFIYYHVFTNQNDKILNLKRGFAKNFSLMTVLISEVIYLSLITAMFKFIEFKINQYAALYRDAAQKNINILQIGTPEQLEYSHAVSNLYGILGLVVFLCILVSFAYTFLKAASIDKNINTDALTSIFKAIYLNLPAYILIFIVTTIIFIFVESYYAQFKLQYLQSYILGVESFSPSIIFIIIRLLILHAVVYMLALFTYCAVGLREKVSLKEKKK